MRGGEAISRIVRVTGRLREKKKKRERCPPRNLFYFRPFLFSEVLKINTTTPHLRYSNTPGPGSDTRACMQQLNALNPTCYYILLTETIFFLTNPEQPTAHQLSLTGLHYFRANEHWGILIIGSTCLRPKCWVVALTLRFASGRSQQPERSKSRNSRKASNRLPAQRPPTRLRLQLTILTVAPSLNSCF